MNSPQQTKPNYSFALKCFACIVALAALLIAIALTTASAGLLSIGIIVISLSFAALLVNFLPGNPTQPGATYSLWRPYSSTHYPTVFADDFSSNIWSRGRTNRQPPSFPAHQHSSHVGNVHGHANPAGLYAPPVGRHDHAAPHGVVNVHSHVNHASSHAPVGRHDSPAPTGGDQVHRHR